MQIAGRRTVESRWKRRKVGEKGNETWPKMASQSAMATQNGRKNASTFCSAFVFPSVRRSISVALVFVCPFRWPYFAWIPDTFRPRSFSTQFSSSVASSAMFVPGPSEASVEMRSVQGLRLSSKCPFTFPTRTNYSAGPLMAPIHPNNRINSKTAVFFAACCAFFVHIVCCCCRLLRSIEHAECVGVSP